MRRFDYLAPESLPEALDMMSDRPEAIPLAGGTDILVQMKEGRRSVEALLSLKRVPELHRSEHNGDLILGAAVTVGRIAADQQIMGDYTALGMGAGMIGSVQVRNMATIGGNLCNAAPSGDTAPPLLALGARVIIAGAGMEREVPIEDFFLEPGRTLLNPGELLKEIVVPLPHGKNGSCYLRHLRRTRKDIATVGVAAAVTLDEDGTIASARLGLGAVAPVPMRAAGAEGLLPGNTLTEELCREAGATAARESEPIDDVRASADYRRHLVNVLTRRALQYAFDRAAQNAG